MVEQDRWLSTSVVQETDNNMGRLNFKGNSKVDDAIATPGYMRSISGPGINRPGLNIEVILHRGHEQEGGNMVGQRVSEINDIEVQPTKEKFDQTKRSEEP